MPVDYLLRHLSLRCSPQPMTVLAMAAFLHSLVPPCGASSTPMVATDIGESDTGDSITQVREELAAEYLAELGYSERPIRNICVVGSDGVAAWDRTYRMVVSADRGSSWEEIPVPSSRGSASFASLQEGCVAGRLGVWRTDNGGNTWDHSRLSPWSSPGFVSIGPNGAGFAVTGKAAWWSADGGQQWVKVEVDTSLGIRSLYPVGAMNLRHAYGVAEVVRPDQGISPSRQTVVLRFSSKTTVEALGKVDRSGVQDIEAGVSSAVAAVTEHSLYYGDDEFKFSLIVLKDGKLPVGFRRCEVFTKGKVLVLARATSTGSELYSVEIASRTCTKLHAWPELKLTAIEFSDNAIGYVGGERGEIFRTADGGENWELIRSPEPAGAWGIDHSWEEAHSAWGLVGDD